MSKQTGLETVLDLLDRDAIPKGTSGAVVTNSGLGGEASAALEGADIGGMAAFFCSPGDAISERSLAFLLADQCGPLVRTHTPNLLGMFVGFDTMTTAEVLRNTRGMVLHTKIRATIARGERVAIVQISALMGDGSGSKPHVLWYPQTDLERMHKRIWICKSATELAECIGGVRLDDLSERDRSRLNGLVLGSCAISARYQRRYSWHVGISGGSSELLFPTSPRGALSMFRDREKIGNRRAALLHWVREHSRISRARPGDWERVAKHLRGRSSFSWRGLDCRLMPSDLERELEITRKSKP